MQVATVDASPKPRKKPAGKPAKPQPDAKVKSTFYLSGDAVKRLGIHAVVEGTDRSALIERLIQDGLRRYVVQDRAGRAGSLEATVDACEDRQPLPAP